jgi:hypothetical protein
MKLTFSGGSQTRPAHSVQPTGVWRGEHTIGRRIQQAIANFLTHLCALFLASVTGLITTAFVVYLVALPLGLAAGLLGMSIGEATATVGAIFLLAFSLLAGITLGTEVYIGAALAQDQWNGPMSSWLRALWAAAAGALVGALPCAVGVDWLLLGPTQAVPHALDSAAAFGTAAHLVSLGGLTGAMTGLAMERFRIWRRPSPNRIAPSSQHARPAPRETDAAQMSADPQPVLPVDQ